MFVAHTRDGQRIEASAADYDTYYRCPECGANVLVKEGPVVRRHFAHLARPPKCDLAGETQLHLTMKQDMRNFFGQAQTQVEVPLVPGHRADVVVPPQRLVVECQVSPIDSREWERRTLDYNRHHFAVLWVWSLARLGLSGTDEEINARVNGEVRIPLEVLRCHQSTYGRIYTLNRYGVFFAVHLYPVIRKDLEGYGYSRTLKTTRTLAVKHIDPVAAPSLILPLANGMRLARMETEHCWWPPN
ncbi:MAG: hypothetical protein H0X24_00720 [Ktedonobacterales bacterium]|nr:hypothetical protein [Ktedonobacterales bacterium]